jgi:hypothetical protein
MERPRGLGRVLRVRGAVLALLVATFLLGGARTARADEEPEAPPAPDPHFGGQRSLGFGPALGAYTGAGGLLVLSAEPIGLMLSGGYVPLLIFGNEKEGKAVTFDYFGSAQLGGDVLIGPLWRSKRVTIDFMLGYRYNTALGSGIDGGVRIAYDLSRAFSLEGQLAPTIFPGAVGHLRDKGYPQDRDPAVPWLQGGMGAAIVFYP